MSLDINIQKLSNHCKISLNGKCTIYNVGKLKEFLITAIETNENILIDLSLVNDFDTAGLQLFVSAKNMVNSKNKKMKIVNHPVCVLSVFDLYGLISFFGDKITVKPEEKKQFVFNYGIKKRPFLKY
ncbi:MAG: STAS domain-containing protein [Leptospiraceae bacterium]|nr:STAS domain-containing protein [Leptospiraceae bacterium]